MAHRMYRMYDRHARPPARPLFRPKSPIRRAGGSSSSAQPEPARGGWWWWCCLVFPVTYVRCTFRMCCTTPGTALLCNSQLPSKTAALDGIGRPQRGQDLARPGQGFGGRKECRCVCLFWLFGCGRSVGGGVAADVCSYRQAGVVGFFWFSPLGADRPGTNLRRFTG